MMPDWRNRLIKAVDDDPRSDRAISLAAKLGPNFVNELRRTDKEPSVKKVLRLAEELNLSINQLFFEREITPEDEEFLAVIKSASEAERKALLDFLHARQNPTE